MKKRTKWHQAKLYIYTCILRPEFLISCQLVDLTLVSKKKFLGHQTNWPLKNKQKQNKLDLNSYRFRVIFDI